MKLRVNAGLFVKLRGSDTVVHFFAMTTTGLTDISDLYEIVLFRKLRRVVFVLKR